MPASFTRAPARLLALLVICAGVSIAAPGDGPATTYHTNVNEVQLSFSVLDRNHHSVANLQAGDFAVVDSDRVVRNFASLTRSDRTKLELGIIIDTSESVQPHFRQETANFLKLVSPNAGTPDRNVSFFSFRGVQPVLLCSGNCWAADAVANPQDTPQAGSLTPLFDTIAFAADYLSQHGDAHTTKILILFSDGEDTISLKSVSDAIDCALSANVQIYGIDLSRSVNSSQGSAVLRHLANSTGGRYFPVQDGAASVLNSIFEDFRVTYTVSYQLPNHASGFHAVRILPTHNLNLEFHSRSGYFYPSPQ